MDILSIQNVVKRYQDNVAVNQVSFNVPKGIIFGLIGPNGAGKTSLIRIITTITQADEGVVYFEGTQINQETSEKIGYMPEERGLYKKMKVGKQLMYLAQLKGLEKADAQKKIDFWLHRFGIEDWAGKKIEELSKGMQQKIQFISTVMHEPPLLILDEPFSGLDPVNAQVIREEIYRLKEKGVSIIFSTHRMESVEEICDEIVLINKGEIKLQGSVYDIQQQFKENRYFIKLSKGASPIEMPGIEIVSHDRNKLSIVAKSYPLANHYIQQMIAKGQFIMRFEEQLPTIQEIFIKTVGKAEINE